jgi:hypothetical protein
MMASLYLGANVLVAGNLSAGFTVIEIGAAFAEKATAGAGVDVTDPGIESKRG